MRLTLDVVNFYADIWRPRQYRARAALTAEPSHGVMATVAVIQGHEATGAGERYCGPFDDVWLPSPSSDDGRELGLDRVSTILAKRPTERTEIDRRLLAALRWSGRATVTHRADEALLHFMMALESLINGPTGRDAILNRLTTRVSHLLPEDADKFAHVEELKRLYGLRSTLVHAGSAVIGRKDIDTARTLTKELTVELLRRGRFAEMRTNKELDRWFEARILGIKDQ